MRQTGRVISSDNEKVTIQVVRESACGGNCKSCGGACNTIGVTITADNTIDARPGEIVNVDSESSEVLKIAAVFYLIPLVVIIAGIVLSKVYLFPDGQSAHSDLIALAVGGSGCILSLIGIHYFTRQKKIHYTLSRKS